MKKIILLLFVVGGLCAVSSSHGVEQSEPYKISAALDNSILLADPLNDQIRILRPDNTEQVIQNNFKQPQAAVQDKDGNLYALDTGNHRLWKFVNKNGYQLVGNIGGWRYPRALALSPDHKWLYVLDSGNNKIVRVQTADFKRANSFGELNNPYGLAVDIYGNIYAADTGTGRILKYNPEGKLLLSFGRPGSLPGELLLPQDVAVGRSKKIYVADTGNKAVQIFSETGAYLGQLKEYTGQEVRSLDFAEGTLWLALVNKKRPEHLALGYKIKSIQQENEYFSPNGDGIQDEAVFRLELESSAEVSLEIYLADKLVERLDANKNQAGILRLAWQPKKAQAGAYDYFLFVRDPENKKEPAMQSGKIYLDLTPPRVEELLVSPDVLADKTTDIVFRARSNERARLDYKIYDPDRQLIYEAKGQEYRFAPELTWSGRNKFQEMRNDKYRAEITLTDQAGNTSAVQRRDIIVLMDHPIFDLAEAQPKYIQEKQAEKLNLRLLRPAKIVVYLRGPDGKEQQIISRELAKGEHTLDIDTQKLTSAKYELRISAESGEYKDETFSGFIVDSILPELNGLNLSPAEMWSGGIDQTALSFKPAEDMYIQIFLLVDKTNEVLVKEFFQATSTEYTYVFNGNRLDGTALPAGDYTVLIETRDLAGNVKSFTIPLRITADGPQIRQMLLKPNILSQDALLYRVIAVNYELTGSAGQLYLTAKLYHNGKLYKIIADRERRSRGFQFDQIYADSSMPEGEYMYEYMLEDNFDHRSMLSGSFFFVRERPRIFNVSQTELAISPLDQNNTKGETVWNFIVQQPEYLTYYARQYQDFAPMKLYLSMNGDLVQEHVVYPGSFQLVWDGRDIRRRYLKNDTYEYEIKVVDALGVYSLPVTGTVIVANSSDKIERAEILVNNDPAETYFNPYAGLETATVNIYLRDFPLRQQLILSLYDEQGNLVETYPTRDFTVSQNYPFTISRELSSGYVLSPGHYYAKLKIVDEIGNDFDYRIGATLNYFDNHLISSGAPKYSLTSVEKNPTGKYEVNYVKGEPVSRTVETKYWKGHDGYDRWFYIDYPQEVIFSITDNTNNHSGEVWISGTGYSLSSGTPPAPIFLNIGGYLLVSWGNDSDHTTYGYVYFSIHDIWYKLFDESMLEQQVDSALDTAQTVGSVERSRRLALVTGNAFTTNYAHAVRAESGKVYYQRRSNGQTTGTLPLLISNADAVASDPSICAGEDNSVYAAWVEQSNGAYSVRAIHIPEKYWAMKNDPALSVFALNTMAVQSAGQVATFAEIMSADAVLAIEKQINYPNPFPDKTTIRYKLTRDADVTIRIFNAAGQPVRQLDFSPGTEGGRGAVLSRPYNDIVWDGNNDFGQSVVNGTYIYEITAKNNDRTVKAKGKMLKWR